MTTRGLPEVTVRVPTADEMRQLGERLGRAAAAGDRFLLQGPFGAGKTTLVQGLARGLDIQAPISSPSFVIETQYRGRLPLYHIDLYRLDGIEHELAQSLEEHLYGDGVSAVEWAERLPPDLRSGAVYVRLRIDGAGRELTLCTSEARLHDALEA